MGSHIQSYNKLASSASCGSTVPAEVAHDQGGQDARAQGADIGDVEQPCDAEDTVPTPTVVVEKEESPDNGGLGEEAFEDARETEDAAMPEVEEDAEEQEN